MKFSKIYPDEKQRFIFIFFKSGKFQFRQKHLKVCFSTFSGTTYVNGSPWANFPRQLIAAIRKVPQVLPPLELLLGRIRIAVEGCPRIKSSKQFIPSRSRGVFPGRCYWWGSKNRFSFPIWEGWQYFLAFLSRKWRRGRKHFLGAAVCLR